MTTAIKISSKMTFFHKRIFPVIWYGFLAFFVFYAFTTGAEEKGKTTELLIGAAFMAILGFFVMKKLVFNVVDEAYDHGDSLVLKNGGREVRIPLHDIINVNYSAQQPPRITLLISKETALGTEISFLPPLSLAIGRLPPLVRDLILRTDQARGRTPSS